jgi:hypothetical protein
MLATVHYTAERIWYPDPDDHTDALRFGSYRRPHAKFKIRCNHHATFALYSRAQWRTGRLLSAQVVAGKGLNRPRPLRQGASPMDAVVDRSFFSPTELALLQKEDGTLDRVSRPLLADAPANP